MDSQIFGQTRNERRAQCVTSLSLLCLTIKFCTINSTLEHSLFSPFLGSTRVSKGLSAPFSKILLPFCFSSKRFICRYALFVGVFYFSYMQFYILEMDSALFNVCDISGYSAWQVDADNVYFPLHIPMLSIHGSCIQYVDSTLTMHLLRKAQAYILIINSLSRREIPSERFNQ